MKLLAFDTSSIACSVALLDTGRPLSQQIQSNHQILPQKHGQFILPMVQALLTQSSLAADRLTALAYGCGPGSFTGLRIASCVAQGLAFGLKKPVVPISSLAAIAQSAFLEHKCANVLVVVDAYMGQVYWACYHLGPQGLMQLVGTEHVSKPSAIALPLLWQQEQLEWWGVGDGWIKYKQELSSTINPFRILGEQLPTAVAILPLASKKFEQGAWVVAQGALPVYLS